MHTLVQWGRRVQDWKLSNNKTKVAVKFVSSLLFGIAVVLMEVRYLRGGLFHSGRNHAFAITTAS